MGARRGIFLTFIGRKNAGFVKADPVTFVKPCDIGWPTMATLLGVLLAVGMKRKGSFVLPAATSAAGSPLWFGDK
jgi:xanthine/uracil/vitamin C permease (AzgA family)